MYEREFSSSIDVIVPVPLHWTRLFGRGFNQSRLLCQGLPPSLVRPAVLRRVRATKPQSSLSAEERLLTLNGAFRAQEAMAGKDVLLVDDVVTSGTTANECAKVLRAAGAKSVSLLAFAGTP
jgi:ComF family protein